METRDANIPSELSGLRLDKASASLFPEFSRNQLKHWIEDGNLQLNGAGKRPRDKVSEGDHLTLSVVLEEQVPCEPEDLPLDILYQDESLTIINKPAGLVVHPGAGNRQGTLQNALLFHDPASINLPRAGIVHRLDKETSGVMVVARTQQAHTFLVAALQERAVNREYRALVSAMPISGGTVDEPIGRHATQRTRMAIKLNGKPAITHYRIAERFRAHTLLKVNLESGRTHQIRVHLAHVHMPVTGDPVYGGRLRLPPSASESLKQTLRQFRRQALHAFRLEFIHPETGETRHWEAPLPDDMQQLLQALRDDAAEHRDC